MNLANCWCDCCNVSTYTQFLKRWLIDWIRSELMAIRNQDGVGDNPISRRGMRNIVDEWCDLRWRNKRSIRESMITRMHDEWSVSTMGGMSKDSQCRKSNGRLFFTSNVTSLKTKWCCYKAGKKILRNNFSALHSVWWQRATKKGNGTGLCWRTLHNQSIDRWSLEESHQMG